jgi:hypothetical protein
MTTNSRGTRRRHLILRLFLVEVVAVLAFPSLRHFLASFAGVSVQELIGIVIGIVVAVFIFTPVRK